MSGISYYLSEKDPLHNSFNEKEGNREGSKREIQKLVFLFLLSGVIFVFMLYFLMDRIWGKTDLRIMAFFKFCFYGNLLIKLNSLFYLYHFFNDTQGIDLEKEMFKFNFIVFWILIIMEIPIMLTSLGSG